MSYNKPKSEQINLGTVTLDSVIDPTGTWIGNPTNLQGATGAQGSAGFVGSNGAQGATGAQGANGSNGTQGATGAQGATGTQGATGAQGTTGGFSTNSDAQVNSLGVGTAASTTTGEIRATNNITAYYSDMRLKNKLYNIPDPLARVMRLSGFFFEPNELAQSLGYELKQEVGVSAQEVEAVLPEAVAPAPIDAQYLTVRYEKLVPLLIEAIKELKREVDEFKANR